MKSNQYDDLKTQLLNILPPAFSPKFASESLPGFCEEKTLANYRSMGRGPAYIKRGRKVLYTREAFVNWLLKKARFVEPINAQK